MQTVQKGGGFLVDPALILADDNSRFGLKPTRVDSMGESILEDGVRDALTVTKMPEDEHGHVYHLNDGHYRLAAVRKLNESGAGITEVPVKIVAEVDQLSRLKTQISANMEREDPTPMDRAISMRRLLDAGMSKLEVRKIFAIQIGNNKKAKIQPLSNSSLNMHLSFLSDLPKAIQERLHDGRWGVGAGYTATRVSKDPARLKQLVEDLDAVRAAQIEKEEKEEAAFLEAEKKREEADVKVQEVLTEAQQKQKERDEAIAAAKKANEAKVAAVIAETNSTSPEETKALREKTKAADAAALKADKEKAAKIKAAERAQIIADELNAKIAAKNEALAKARAQTKTASKDPKPVTAKEVKEAAKKQGKPLPTQEFKKTTMEDVKALARLLMAPSSFPKVQQIGQAISQYISTTLPLGEAHKRISQITGELEVKVKAEKAKKTEK